MTVKSNKVKVLLYFTSSTMHFLDHVCDVHLGKSIPMHLDGTYDFIITLTHIGEACMCITLTLASL